MSAVNRHSETLFLLLVVNLLKYTDKYVLSFWIIRKKINEKIKCEGCWLFGCLVVFCLFVV